MGGPSRPGLLEEGFELELHRELGRPGGRGAGKDGNEEKAGVEGEGGEAGRGDA